MLQDGACWRVGTGSNISILNDAWVLGAPNFKLFNQVINGNLLIVDRLIDNQNRNWRSDLVNYTFNAVDAERILSIPLAMDPHDDEIAWSGEASSVFFVRSAYKLLQSGLPAPTFNNLQTHSKDFYKKLWCLNIPPKIKICIWCISKNFLPTRENMCHHRLLVDAMCPVCGNGAEDLSHIFCACPITKGIWVLMGFEYLVSHITQGWFGWLIWAFGSLSREQAQAFCCILWTLWNKCNKRVHEKFSHTNEELAMFIASYLKEIDGLEGKLLVVPKSVVRWTPPSLAAVMINFDASFAVKESRSGSRVAIKDSTGKVLVSTGFIHDRV